MRSFRDRYPPPWRPEKTPSYYQVIASNGMSLAFIYAEDNWASTNQHRLKWSEAKALAVAIAKLPDTLAKPGRKPISAR